MVEGVQYNGKYAVRRRHIIVMVEGIKYGSFKPSVRRRHIISMVECEIWISHIISMDEGVQYGTTKTTQGVVGCCIYQGKIIFTDNLSIT